MLFCGLDCPIPLDINLEEFLPANLWVHEVANDLVNVPLLIDSRPLLKLLELRGPTVFDTEEKQLCLRKSKAQLPGRLAELCFTPGKVAFLLCQRL